MNDIKLIGSYLGEEKNFSPAGVHLRWNLPTNQSARETGYSFTIFRQTCLPHNTSKIEKRENFQKESSLENIGFTIKNRENSQILSQFKEPLVYLKLSLSPSQRSDYRRRMSTYSRSKKESASTMKAYYKNIEVASITNTKTLSIINVEFDTVLLTLGNLEINNIEFLTAAQYCASESWEVSSHVNKATELEEIQTKLKGVTNRYAPFNIGLDELVDRYLNKLEALNSPVNDPTDEGDGEIIHNDDDIYFQKIIHIAATDPNMARILGLYYVDTVADPEECYNYKIISNLQNGKQIECGLLLNVNGKTNALETPLLLEAKQAKGFTWEKEKREPLAKVDLFWKPIIWSINKIQPLYYDVKRNREEITLDAPIPSYRQKHNDEVEVKHLFRDQPLKMKKYSYQSRSIDIFGRVSNYTDSVSIVLEDLLPPPTPVRLKTAVTYFEKEEEYTGTFSFEYGYHQHKQAPDAKSIQLYWREHSLILRETGQISSYEDYNGKKKIEFYNMKYDALIAFIGGTISLDTRQKIISHEPVNIEVPNSQRQSYTILDVDVDGIILESIAPDENSLEDNRFLPYDICELRSAKGNRRNWINLTGDTKIKTPLRTNEVGEFFDPHIIFKHKYTNPDFLNDEVCINLDILEANLFKDYTVEGKVIRFSTLGSDKDAQKPYLRARLGFDSTAISALSENHTYSLTPPIPPENNDNERWLVKAVKCTNIIEYDVLGGEVAFEFDTDQVIIARVVGYQRDGEYLLVKLRKRDLDILLDTLQQEKVYAIYYAPYLVSDQVIHLLSPKDELPVNEPYWINYLETQVLKGYIAASTKDDRGNESEFSLPVEVSTIKPANFPKMLSAPGSEIVDGDRGLASPPNFEGKSFVKLLWLGDFEGYRLEIARVLDSTLVLGVKKSWLNGENIDGPMIPTLPAIPGKSIETPKLLSNESIEVIFEPNESISDLEVFLNGRMKIKRLPAVSNECVKAIEIPEFATFKIIYVSQNGDGNLVLILSPVNGKSEEFKNNSKLDKNTCIIDIQPNFNNLAKIDAFLAMLANNPSHNDLFTIVSKVPVSIENGGATFIDEIPGIGSNRFFYKVRLVDVADNRSAWSPCSIPVYQLDTTAPEPVKNLEIIHLSDNKSLLSWDVSDEKNLYGYSIAGEEIAKEDFKYKQQATPLDQVLFSKSIDIPLDALDSIQLSIIDIHKPEESLSLRYDYIYVVDEYDVLQVKGILFYEEQRGNLVITVIDQDGENYITEGFDRNRWVKYIDKPEEKIEIFAIKKTSYKDEIITVKSKKMEV